MSETSAAYIEAKKTMEKVLQLPEAERRVILDMMRGALTISDLYAAVRGGE